MGRIIDYNEFWKLAVKRRPSFKKEEDDPGASWDKRADYYDSSVRENLTHTLKDISFLDLKPDDTVLDVGAGTGRLAVPISAKVKAVTAIDPSARMLMYLRDNMIESKRRNCRCVQKRWEDVCLKKDLDPHDVVISAFSMGFADARWALDKLHRASKRMVYIYWFAGKRRDDEFLKYIADKMGKNNVEKPHFPDYICIMNVLHDMGIYADLKIYQYEWHNTYRNIEDAVSKALLNRRITADEKSYAYEYFEKTLKKEENGLYSQKIKTSTALISWNVEETSYTSDFV
ncbi:class I SAM-dependent methyltransferase [Methanoplanus sp. FWC-SCC4]|uniref:Class I SAM-dependent methyltransferase n=1 Tax=Methanochimaera problematica TaxID=2609417 RepID=A0AA97I3Z6_9EURY|nr:class I SAM-dependent methyltransferase [Methanoplanus sp. FWC-SCC4]WOF17203.1 class I SAM-dependent methyltransferase [Methanoplanus sp. FWC-SCC4]